MPCDIAVLNAMDGRGVTDAIMEAVAILNNQFEKRKVIKNNILIWQKTKILLILEEIVIIRMMNNMSKDTAQLLIFNTFNEDPVIKSYSAAKQIDNNEAWCDFFSALVEKGEELGLSGRLFSSYVIYSLTKGDNIIADNIQHNGNIGKSLELLLKADMEIIYPYLQNELQGSSYIFNILNNYEP